MRMKVKNKPLLVLSCMISLILCSQMQLNQFVFNYFPDLTISKYTQTKTTTEGQNHVEDTYLPSKATSVRYKKELMEENRKNIDNKEPILIMHRAVSGLGHRLIKMTSAYHLVKTMNYTNGLFNSWGWECKGKKENSSDTMDIFYYLFGDDVLSVPILPQPPIINRPFVADLRRKIKDASDKAHLMEANKTMRIINEMPGYNTLAPYLIKQLPWKSVEEKLHSDFEMYSRLRGLFRDNDVALDFIQQHDYTNHYVFGLHIRAGNGEKGHFQAYLREVANLEEWIALFAKMMLEYVTTEEYAKVSSGKPPLLFVATDTEKSVHLLKTHLSNNNSTTDDNTISIPVINFPQQFMSDGAGVSFRYKFSAAEECYQSWRNQFMDMTLLSASDNVIAGMYSSFTQSMPMRMMIANPIKEKNKMFCEVGRTGANMHCVTSYSDWLELHTDITNATYILIGSKKAPGQKFESRQDFPVFDVVSSRSGFLERWSQEGKSDIEKNLVPKN